MSPLAAQLEASGWAVTRETLTHANGYTDPEKHTFALGLDLAPEQAAKTLMHETAHIRSVPIGVPAPCCSRRFWHE